MKILLSLFLWLPFLLCGMEEHKVHVPKGLANPNNACFINAGLQALHASSDLISMALELDRYAKPGSLFELLRAWALKVRTGQENCIYPQEIHTALWQQLGIEQAQQGDVNECLSTLLLHATEHDILETYKPYVPCYEGTQTPCTELSQLFFVHVRNVRLCSENEAFIGMKAPEQEIGLTVAVRKGDTNLIDCLTRHFGAEQELFRTDPETLTEGINRRFLHNTQNYLFIMLNHTEAHQTERGIEYVRQETPISFPLNNLDLSTYFFMKERNKGPYELIALIMHNGTAQSGHYVAYTKIGDQWYLCNDGSITLVPEKTMGQIARDGFADSRKTVATTFVYELSSARPKY